VGRETEWALPKPLQSAISWLAGEKDIGHG
jgi:hypothetical protein